MTPSGNVPGRVLGRGLKDLTSTPLHVFRPAGNAVSGASERTLAMPDADSAKPYPRVLVITSGKGGTGKSFMTVNLACALAQLDKRVLIIDADFGLANDHLLLGLNPRYDISHLVTGRWAIGDVIVTGPNNVKLLGGCSGIAELSTLSYERFCIFIAEVLKVERDFDWILIDSSAGISPQVMSFLTAAREVILVVNPEATSMLDAYAVMKTLFLRHPSVQVGFIANRVKDSIVARESYKKLNGAVEHYLKRSLAETGFVVLDAAVGHSLVNRRPVVLDAPHSHAAFCIKKIAQKIAESQGTNDPFMQPSYFTRLRKEVFHWQNGYGRSDRKVGISSP